MASPVALSLMTAALLALPVAACGGRTTTDPDGGSATATPTATGADGGGDGAPSTSPVTWPACEGTVAAACSGDNTCFKRIDVATEPATWTSFCAPGREVRLARCNGYAVVDVAYAGGARTYFYDVVTGELSAILCVQDPAQSVAGRTCNGTALSLCARH